jgi:hypothetical protein
MIIILEAMTAFAKGLLSVLISNLPQAKTFLGWLYKLSIFVQVSEQLEFK